MVVQTPPMVVVVEPPTMVVEFAVVVQTMAAIVVVVVTPTMVVACESPNHGLGLLSPQTLVVIVPSFTMVGGLCKHNGDCFVVVVLMVGVLCKHNGDCFCGGCADDGMCDCGNPTMIVTMVVVVDFKVGADIFFSLFFIVPTTVAVFFFATPNNGCGCADPIRKWLSFVPTVVVIVSAVVGVVSTMVVVVPTLVVGSPNNGCGCAGNGCCFSKQWL